MSHLLLQCSLGSVPSVSLLVQKYCWRDFQAEAENYCNYVQLQMLAGVLAFRCFKLLYRVYLQLLICPSVCLPVRFMSTIVCFRLLCMLFGRLFSVYCFCCDGVDSQIKECRCYLHLLQQSLPTTAAAIYCVLFQFLFFNFCLN